MGIGSRSSVVRFFLLDLSSDVAVVDGEGEDAASSEAFVASDPSVSLVIGAAGTLPGAGTSTGAGPAGTLGSGNFSSPRSWTSFRAAFL